MTSKEELNTKATELMRRGEEAAMNFQMGDMFGAPIETMRELQREGVTTCVELAQLVRAGATVFTEENGEEETADFLAAWPEEDTVEVVLGNLRAAEDAEEAAWLASQESVQDNA